MEKEPVKLRIQLDKDQMYIEQLQCLIQMLGQDNLTDEEKRILGDGDFSKQSQIYIKQLRLLLQSHESYV